MALETLKGVEEIGGYKVAHPHDMNGDYPIGIDHQNNSITFKIQDGPIKENGVNGCQVDTLIHTALIIIDELNKKFPSDWNDQATFRLTQALHALTSRTKDRESRNVEGTSNE